MKLRKSSYRYVYNSFTCYPHEQSYRYHILKPSDRIKNRILQPISSPFDKATRRIMHIYDTLQLTVYNGAMSTTNEWVLRAL